MTAHRRTLRAAALAGSAAFAAPLLLTLSAAGPAQAHGAPTNPVSRAFACSPDGGSLAGTAACRAALAANGGAPFTFWDNVRVGGRERPGPRGDPRRPAVQRRAVRLPGTRPRPLRLALDHDCRRAPG